MVDCLTAGGRPLRFALAQIDHVTVVVRWRQRAGRRNVLQIVRVVVLVFIMRVILINDGNVGQIEDRSISLIDCDNRIISVVASVVAFISTAEVPPATTVAAAVVSSALSKL